MYYYKNPLRRSKVALDGEEISKDSWFVLHSIDKMLEVAGYNFDYNAIKDDDKWYHNYTITSRQLDQFEDWFNKEYKRFYNYSSDSAFNWFNLSWGLREFNGPEEESTES